MTGVVSRGASKNDLVGAYAKLFEITVYDSNMLACILAFIR